METTELKKLSLAELCIILSLSNSDRKKCSEITELIEGKLKELKVK